MRQPWAEDTKLFRPDQLSCDALLEPLSREHTHSTGRHAAAGVVSRTIPPCHIFLLGQHNWGAMRAREPITHLWRSFCCFTLALFPFHLSRPETATGLIKWLCKFMAVCCSQEDVQNIDDWLLKYSSLSSYVPSSQSLGSLFTHVWIGDP